MKLDKKLGFVLIFVVLALVSVSTVAAITIKYPKIEGLGNIFNLKIIVNAIVIAAIAYFVMPLLLGKERTPQTKAGHAAMLIMIIILSIVIAVSIGDKYLWQGTTIKSILDYFIGSEGILKANRIGIFLGATALFTWFLTFLGVGTGEKGKVSKINFALAFLIGMHLAREGISPNTLIGIGQAFAIIIFWQNIYKGLELKGGKYPWLWPAVALIITLILVGWVGYILSPCKWGAFGLIQKTTEECAEETIPVTGLVEAVQKDGAAAIPMVLWSLSKFFLSNWWFIFVIIGILILLGTWAARKEDAFRRAKFGFVAEGFIRLGNLFRDLIRNRRIPLLWRLLKKHEIYDKEITNQMPKSWENLTVLLNVFYNWILRLEVFTTKHRIAVRAEEDANKIEREVMTDTKDIGNIKSDLKMYKEGSEILEDEKEGFKLSVHNAMYMRSTGRLEKAKTPTSYGKLNMEWFVFWLLNRFKRVLESGDELTIRDNLSSDEKTKLQESLIERDIGTVEEKYNADIKRWDGAHKRYSYWHRIRSLRASILDQYRMYGRYYHSYKFANATATVYKYDYDREKALKGNPLNRKVVPTANKGELSKKVGLLKERPENLWGIPLLHEVNHRGVFVEDINRILVEGEELEYVRKINPTKTNIVDHEDSHEVMDWNKLEWNAFLEDLRFGTFHPHSLGVRSYIRCMNEKDFAFKDVKKEETDPPVGPDNPAFDLEALKDPGLMVYWGRKRYYEDNNYNINNESIQFVNPFPALSTRGMTEFIAEYVRRRTKPVTAKTYLGYLVGDSAAAIDSVFALLSELEKSQKKEE